MSPLFTQKHYEHLVIELRRRKRLPAGMLNILSDIFAADNPEFRKSLFRKLLTMEDFKSQKEKTDE